FPSFWGLMITTFIGSVGFHYFETVNQSLQLQWLSKERAPQALGWIVAMASVGSLIAYSGVAIGGQVFGFGYDVFYWVGGGMTVALAFVCWLGFPEFRAPVEQRKEMVLRSRYWLYYALVFMGGARRQIFMVFAAFMMVEKFGLDLHQMAWLFVINYVANMIFAPLVGRFIQDYGERMAMVVEYLGLIGVFSLYVGIYVFDWSWQMAAALYVIDHLFFAMAFAQKTYFQKIADPADQAPTAAVAFTINHIAAVFLPASLGYLWLVEPMAVFGLAVALSCISLILAFLVPRHPEEGCETILSRGQPLPAE
ncbi:MAG: MFS transporter, partial [Pseudomonadota bacterium]